MATNFRINLGDKVRHQINGVEGVVTARVQCLTGCNKYVVAQPGIGNDGKLKESFCFDEDSLIVIGSIELVAAEARAHRAK